MKVTASAPQAMKGLLAAGPDMAQYWTVVTVRET